MQALTRIIDAPSRTSYFKFTFIGDTHYGHHEYDERLLVRSIERIKKDESHYIVGMGDYAEYIAISDKRFDPRDIVDKKELYNLFKRQAQRAAKVFEPVSDRILGLLRGNHEDKVVTRYSYDPHEEFCECVSKRPDIDLGYSAFLRVKFRRAGKFERPLKIFLHHGFGGGGTAGGLLNKVKTLAVEHAFCDIYGMGHCHDRFVHFATAKDISPQKDEFVTYPRVFFMSGTFKHSTVKGHSGWAEQTGKRPTSIGCITLLVEPCGDNGIVIRDVSGSDGLPG